MIRRIFGSLMLSDADADAPAASHQLEQVGYAHLDGVFTTDEVATLRREIDEVFNASGAERTRPDGDEFRYEMFNRSPAALDAVAHPTILEVIEPLLGDDCHIIANTAWRNPPSFRGGPWHTDAGPHVPRPEGVPWDDRIPYPVFAIAAHILLTGVTPVEGSTAVIPRSHRSGRPVPVHHLNDPDLTCDDEAPVLLGGRPGDVLLFVSDVWHRGVPADAERSAGREFLQVHYGRRDIAQRVRATAEVNHVDEAVAARIEDPRRRQLVGLHDPFFYDG